MGAPQEVQNDASGETWAPQLAQNMGFAGLGSGWGCSTASFVPQLLQNAMPGLILAPQLGQCPAALIA